MAEETNRMENLTFKEGMSQLEHIVSLLESGDMELEQSLEQYAQGVKLLSMLQNRLTVAEQQVQILMGELAQAPEDDVQDTTLLKA